MKTTYSFLLLIILLASGCDNTEIVSTEKLTDGFCIVSNDQVVLNHYDIEYYDYSTHLIYMKNNKSFDDDIEIMETFTVTANGEDIYSGQTLPSYSSFMPSGPVIYTHPTFYGDYIIAIGFNQIIDTLGNATPDPREDERIVEALKRYNQFHSGLSCEIKSVQYSSSTNVKIELILDNSDSFNYYFLDPQKMGINLFHYFTNGLFIRDITKHISYTHNIETTQPEPWNSWKKEWLSIIKSNDSKTISIVYDKFEIVPPGEYTATFEFPGLNHQVDKKDLEQRNGRIWLGELNLFRNITIE